MTILIVMIPLSILLLIGAGIAFFWAVDHDQFDDMQTPALLPLLDAPDAAEAPEVIDAGATPDPATKSPR
jgi:cbb3-type cytochrome oxidase maturation protein